MKWAHIGRVTANVARTRPASDALVKSSSRSCKLRMRWGNTMTLWRGSCIAILCDPQCRSQRTRHLKELIMSRNLAITALRFTAACLILALPTYVLAKESDPGGKDADTDAEIVFEPTSEGDAAAHPTADEKPIDFDAKRPSILGMTVIEGDDGRPRVIDVGASSPAWDAGIRKDDVILSLHGVQGKSFQEWAEGVQKVVADAKAGQTIPVEVLRDSTPLDLQVRISEQKGNKPPRPVRKQRPNIAINQAP